MNPDAKVCVIGFIKCGQVSLVKYFENKLGKDKVRRLEIVSHPDGPRMFAKKYPNWTPVIITRNPIERCWSQFWYFRAIKKGMSYKQYLDFFEPHPYFGNVNPLYISNYEPHIARWQHLNPLIFILEDMMLDPAFPYDNKTAELEDIKDIYRPITSSEFEVTKHRLDLVTKYNICGGGQL